MVWKQNIDLLTQSNLAPNWNPGACVDEVSSWLHQLQCVLQDSAEEDDPFWSPSTNIDCLKRLICTNVPCWSSAWCPHSKGSASWWSHLVHYSCHVDSPSMSKLHLCQICSSRRVPGCSQSTCPQQLLRVSNAPNLAADLEGSGGFWLPQTMLAVVQVAFPTNCACRNKILVSQTLHFTNLEMCSSEISDPFRGSKIWVRCKYISVGSPAPPEVAHWALGFDL